MSSDANLGESLQQIERLANRLVDWNGFRIWRLNNGSLRLIYQAGEGLLAEPRENGVFGGRLRDIAMSTRRAARHHRRHSRRARRGHRSSALSLAVVPLRFGDRAIGLVELDHHKRGTYGAKEITLVARFANQLATALHIQDLRQPLLAALARVETQLDTLNDSARALRGGRGSRSRATRRRSRAASAKRASRPIAASTSRARCTRRRRRSRATAATPRRERARDADRDRASRHDRHGHRAARQREAIHRREHDADRRTLEEHAAASPTSSR